MAARPRPGLPQLTPDQCAQFRANPTRNPISGAKIQPGKGTYLELIRQCGQPSGQIAAPMPGIVAPQVQFQPQGQIGLGGLAIPGQPFGVQGMPVAPLPQQGGPQIPSVQLGQVSPQRPAAQIPAVSFQLPQAQAAPQLPQITAQAQFPGVSLQPAPQFQVPGLSLLQGLGGATQPIIQPAPVPLPTGPSVLVILEQDNGTSTYIVPQIAETADLIDDLFSIDQTSSGQSGLTQDQRDIYENIEGDLNPYYVGNQPIRGVNITSVVVIHNEDSSLSPDFGSNDLY